MDYSNLKVISSYTLHYCYFQFCYGPNMVGISKQLIQQIKY